MKELEKYITDEQTGLRYELVVDYYYIAGDDEPEDHRPIGIWGQLHRDYIKQNKKSLYTALLITGKLHDYLADINEQAEKMLFQLVNQIARQEGITEELKRIDQMAWGAGLRWRPLPKAEALTEATAETLL